MKRHVSDISREYAKGFMRFLVDNNISEYKSAAYELFVYSLYSVYGFTYTKKLNTLITKNGEKCVAYLKTLDGVPKRLGYLTFEEKQSIVDCSCVYTVVALQYYTGGIKVVK